MRSDPGTASGSPSPGESAAAGERNEFARLFRGAYRSLWGVAVGVVGNAHLAEDVVQEAAVIAMDKFDSFTPGTSFAAWAGQIVRNVALNSLRKERRRSSKAASVGFLDEVAEAGDQSPSAPGPTSAKLAADSNIAEALAEVSDIARACLLLRTLEDMDYARISAVLGIPEGTAMSHVHRTRKVLRGKLESVVDREDRRPTA